MTEAGINTENCDNKKHRFYPEHMHWNEEFQAFVPRKMTEALADARDGRINATTALNRGALANSYDDGYRAGLVKGRSQVKTVDPTWPAPSFPEPPTPREHLKDLAEGMRARYADFYAAQRGEGGDGLLTVPVSEYALRNLFEDVAQLKRDVKVIGARG